MPRLDVSLDRPWGWPLISSELGELPRQSGVYVMTIAIETAFRPYAVGLTRRPLRKRFHEHRRNFLRGEYNILDLDSARAGVRKLVWKGWGWTPEKREQFVSQQFEIERLAKVQMSATAVFNLSIPDEGRLYERLEAAIVAEAHLRGNLLIDHGMYLAPRREYEAPISLDIRNSEAIEGLPATLTV